MQPGHPRQIPGRHGQQSHFRNFGETTRLITLLATVVFGCQSDGPLKSCLKSTSDPLEVVNNCQFLADALSEISAKNKDESAGHPDSAGEKKQGDSQKVDDDDDGIETSLNDLVTPEQLEADDSGKLDLVGFFEEQIRQLRDPCH